MIVPEVEEGVTPSDKKKVDIVSAPKIASVTPRNWVKYRHYFLGVGNDKIKKTFDATTQYAPTILSGEKVRQTHTSAFLALNVPRRHEDVATNTIDASTKAIDTKFTSMQFYVGRKSLFISVYGMNDHGVFVNTLLDEICKNGAMEITVGRRIQPDISPSQGHAETIPDWRLAKQTLLPASEFWREKIPELQEEPPLDYESTKHSS